MARHSPRSEVIIAVGLLAFIAIAFLKPWGSTAQPDPKADPTSVAFAIQSATALATPSPSLGDVAHIATTIRVPTTPVGLVEAEGEVWFPIDGGHLIRVETGTPITTEVELDPTRFPGTVDLAADLSYLWVTGAEDHSVGVLDTVSLEVSRIPAVTTEPMVIDKIHGASADGGSLWFLADVHASQEILGTPCCNGFTSTMLYRADVESGTMTQVRHLQGPLAIQAAFGAVWVLARPDGSDSPAVIYRLDAGRLGPTGTVIVSVGLPAVGSGFSPCGACITSFLVGSNSLWVPTGLGNSIVRVDPAAGRIAATIDLGRDVESVVEAPDGYIWVAGGGPSGGVCDPAAGYVAVIDPATNRVVGESHIACPVSLVVHDRDIWVGTDDPAGPLLQRIQPTH